MISVPSADSFQVELLGEYAWVFMAPFHRTLFSQKGLEKLLTKCGFKTIEFLEDNRHSWGFMRGLAWKNNLSRQHNLLRKNEYFRKLDFAIDDLIDRHSIDIRQSPSITVKASI